MDDSDFKMAVIERLTRIETEVKMLSRSIPQCQKERVNLNRKLIFLLLATCLGIAGKLVLSGVLNA